MCVANSSLSEEVKGSPSLSASPCRVREFNNDVMMMP